MDFTLTNELLMLRKMYREFAENEIKPLAAEIDEEERFRKKVFPSWLDMASWDSLPQEVRRPGRYESCLCYGN